MTAPTAAAPTTEGAGTGTTAADTAPIPVHPGWGGQSDTPYGHGDAFAGSYGGSYGHGDAYGDAYAQPYGDATAHYLGDTGSFAAPRFDTTVFEGHDGPGHDGPVHDGPADGGDLPGDIASGAASETVGGGTSSGALGGGWNPGEESLAPVRGRHRVAKQRGMARSGAVLGVGMMAAVGAGGMATAQDHSQGSLSMPDLASVKDKLPAAGELPGIGSLLAADTAAAADAAPVIAADAPLTQAAVSPADAAEGRTDAGEALRARILEQAAAQQSEADSDVRTAAVADAAADAEDDAAAKAKEAAEKAAEAKREAAEEAKRKAEAERLAKLARTWSLPTSNFQLSAGYGQGGDMWSADHTGQDFAAPTGTPVMAVHSGTVKEAGWAGSYGYRIVLELEDGTEVWYCHLSSMQVSAGTDVTTKDVIGNVGSTGNSTGPHLHVEVHPGGGDPLDPLPWLRAKGLSL